MDIEKRIKPEINSRDAHERIRMGLLCVASSLLGGFFLLLYFLGGFTVHKIGFVVLAVLFMPVLLFQTWMGIKEVISGATILKIRKRWLTQTVRMQAAVIDRKCEYNEYAETRETEYSCEMTLKIPPPAAGSDADGRLIWAYIDKATYDRFAHRDSVPVHYSTTNPLVMLIDGE
jgi:hypothetical protein